MFGGGYTYEYLLSIGFSSTDIDIIGCPSMYLYGDYLPLKKWQPLKKQSKISISYHGNHDGYFGFLQQVKQSYSNYMIIPQGIKDLRLLYAGDEIIDDSLHNYYIKTESDNSYKDNKICMFLDVSEWIRYLNGFDFGIGSCIHGSIASILAGNPTILFASDSRTRELAEVHGICMQNIDNISEKTSINELYNKMEFNKVLSCHRKNYLNYKNFLLKNGIHSMNTNMYKVNFDEEMTSEFNSGYICPYINLSKEEQRLQLQSYANICQGKMSWWLKNGGQQTRGYNNWYNSYIATIDKIQRMAK